MNLGKKVSVFGKSVPIALIVLAVLAIPASAAVLQYFGVAEGNADVTQAIVLDGQTGEADLTLFDTNEIVAGDTTVDKYTVTNNMDEAYDLSYSSDLKNESSGNELASEVPGTKINWTGETGESIGINTKFVRYFDDAGADLPSWNGKTCDVTVSNESELQDAVSNGTTGEVICIDSNFTLSSSLKITDADEVITSKTSTRQTVGTGNQSLQVKADGVTIKGLDIESATKNIGDVYPKGIKLTGGTRSNVRIVNNKIEGWEPIILNSRNATDNEPKHSNITIKDNDISGENIGIMAFTVDNSTIENNYIHDIDVGIQMSAYGTGNVPANNEIKGNTFERNISGPNVIGSTVQNYYDILLQAKDTTITSNELIGSGEPTHEWGIIVTDSIYGSDHNVSGNEIHHNNIYGHSKEGAMETEGYYSNLDLSGYSVNATNNYWGKDGISTSGNVEATSDFFDSVEPGDSKLAVINEFDTHMSGASDYTLTTEIS